MATIKQKRAVNEIVKEIVKKAKSGEKVEIDNYKKLLKKAGFSEATAHNPTANVLSAKGFQDLLKEKLNESKYLDKLDEIAEGSDKRAALKSIRMIFDLTDRFPKKKVGFSLVEEQDEVVE